MPNPPISIGDDTPTGEPENGPRGPYITDVDDGGRIEDMLKQEKNRDRPPGLTPADRPDATDETEAPAAESDLTSEKGPAQP